VPSSLALSCRWGVPLRRWARASLDGVLHRAGPQQPPACVVAQQVGDGAAHLHQVGRKAEQLHIARVPGHQPEVGVDDDHPLGQVLQAAREARVRLLGGLLRCLNDAVLRGAQFLGVLLQHGLQLLTAALAQAIQALALAHKEHQQRERQPAASARGCGPAAVGQAAVRCMHQVQLPRGAGQGLGLPQHAACGRGHVGGRLQAHQAAAVVHMVVHAQVQGAQRLIGILAGGVQFAPLVVVQRLQQSVPPGILAGKKDNAIGVRGEHDIGCLQPFALQLLQRNLDGHQSQDLAAVVADGLRQKVAWLPGGHANAVKTAAPLGQCLLHIGAKTVVLPHVAGRGAPVAGGHGHAAAVEQGEGGGLAGAVGLLQFAVELLHLCRAQGAAQGVLQLRVQGQHFGQRAVAVNALGQRLSIQGQLALHAFALVMQRPLPGPLTGRPHAEHRAHKQGEQRPELAKAGHGHGRKAGLSHGGGATRVRWRVCRIPPGTRGLP
jgi:hypothetical protein